MLRHPDVLDVQAHLVHATDRIEYNSVTKQITDHAFNPFDPARKFEKIEDVQGGYLEVTYRDRSRPNRFHFVTQDSIRKARACAQTQNVWNNWFKEQALKTVYRNAYQRRVIPIDLLVNQRVETLAKTEDTALGNDPSRITSAEVVPSQPALSRSAHLASQLAASQQSPPIVSTPTEPTTVEQPEKAAKATKKAAPKSAKTESIHPPALPEYLDDYAKAIHSCRNADDVADVFEQYVGCNGQLSEADFQAGESFRDWKLASLGGKKDGSLFPKNENTGK
jgi:hypothetical protein